MPDLTLRSDEIIIGCVTEDQPKYLGQTLRLLQSIRWFGGSLSQARVIVGAVDKIDRRARRTLESWGGEVGIVPRFPHPNLSANRLQLIPVLLQETRASHFLMLDCDTIVVQDPLPSLRRDVFHAKIAPFPTVTHACFERLFAHFGLPLPERTHVTSHTRTPTIPYFNAGVFSMSRDIATRLVPEWRRYNAILADNPELAAPCARHLHQSALTLGLIASGVPMIAAGSELNYQLNHTRNAPRAYAEIDPVIIHYHDLVDDDGLLLRCPFPRARQRIERFNERLLSERARNAAVRGHLEGPPRQFVILGTPGGGASLTAALLAAMGARAGEPRELVARDVYEPLGSGRRRDVDALHGDIFTALGATTLEPDKADFAMLPAAARSAFTDRARDIAQRMSLLHDERMSLLFPLWRDALERPFAVLVWREPLAAARSLVRATGTPLVIGIAVWEAYTRRMLAATVGEERVLVSYEQLANGDVASLSESTGLPPLGSAELASIVLRLVEEHRSADDEILNPRQRELRDGLRSGEALQWSDVPPASAETRALLAAFGRNEAVARDAVKLRERIREITGSRVWRVGSRVAALLRRLV